MNCGMYSNKSKIDKTHVLQRFKDYNAVNIFASTVTRKRMNGRFELNREPFFIYTRIKFIYFLRILDDARV